MFYANPTQVLSYNPVAIQIADRLKKISLVKGDFLGVLAPQLGYDESLNPLLNIKQASIHIIDPSTLSTTQLAIELSHSMLEGKWILLTKPLPTFQPRYIERIVAKNFHRMLLIDITILDNEDLKSLLASLQGGVNYTLPIRERITLKSYLKREIRLMQLKPH